MQITDGSLKILKDHDGELKNYLLNITTEQLIVPSANICASVRWIFRKKELATNRLGREATWLEGVAEYKSYLGKMMSGENPNPQGMKDIMDNYPQHKDVK